MRLTVNGVERQFDAKTVTNREAMDLEVATGMTFGEWGEALQKRSMLAMTGLVWIVLRREDPKTKFSDVEFTIGGLKGEADEDDEEPVDPTNEPSEPAV